LKLQLCGAFLFSIVAVALYSEATCFFGPGALRSRPLLQILLVAASLSAAGCLCLAAHAVVYAANGWGLGPLEIFGKLLACLSRLVLSMLQLFVARGKGLVDAPEEWVRRCYLRVVLLGTVVMSVGCELYGRSYLDWSTTLYFYSSWPGTIVLLLNIGLFVDVCTSTLWLYRQPETSAAILRFYGLTSAVALLFFATLPVTCALAHIFAPWHRKKFIARTEIGMRFVATALLACCLRPSRLDAAVGARLQIAGEARERAVELAAGLAEAGQQLAEFGAPYLGRAAVERPPQRPAHQPAQSPARQVAESIAPAGTAEEQLQVTRTLSREVFSSPVVHHAMPVRQPTAAVVADHSGSNVSPARQGSSAPAPGDYADVFA